MAHGKAFKASTILHGMELLEDEVKVMIEEVPVLFALLHVPTNEVYTMAHTFKCFLAWLRDLVDYGPPVQTFKPTIY